MTTETKFTPGPIEFTAGPWKVCHGEATKVRDRKGGCIAILSQTGHGGKFGGRRPNGEATANAHLIAAGPDLYTELRASTALLHLFEMFMDNYSLQGHQEDLRQQVLARIDRNNDALKTARGNAKSTEGE